MLLFLSKTTLFSFTAFFCYQLFFMLYFFKEIKHIVMQRNCLRGGVWCVALCGVQYLFSLYIYPLSSLFRFHRWLNIFLSLFLSLLSLFSLSSFPLPFLSISLPFLSISLPYLSPSLSLFSLFSRSVTLVCLRVFSL